MDREVIILVIFQKKLQRAPDGGKGQFVPRNVIQVEEAGFQSSAGACFCA